METKGTGTMTVRQAIRTAYHGPTDRSGSRIVASWGCGRRVFGYRHELDGEENHIAAAAAVAAELGWTLSSAVGVFGGHYYHAAI